MGLVLALGAAAALILRQVTATPRRVGSGAETAGDAGTLKEVAGWAAIGMVALVALGRSLLTPEVGWDAYSHWGLRAQAYASVGTVVDAGSEHEYYPPLVPLLEAWFDLHHGQVSLDLAKSVWATVGGAFALALSSHLRRMIRTRWLAPWLALGIVLVSPELLDGFWTGQADLPVTAFLTLASLAAWQWTRQPDRRWLVQVGVFAAAAGLCKLEAAPRLAIVGLALGVDAIVCRRAHRVRPIVVLAIATLVAVLVWTLAANGVAISPNSEHLGAFQPAAIPAVALALLRAFGGVRTAGGVLLALLAWLLAGRALMSPGARLLTLIALGEVAATCASFLIGSADPVVQVQTSATRLVAQSLPLVLCAAIVALDSTVLSGGDSYNRRQPE